MTAGALFCELAVDALAEVDEPLSIDVSVEVQFIGES
jgi:hypothetical protein